MAKTKKNQITTIWSLLVGVITNVKQIWPVWVLLLLVFLAACGGKAQSPPVPRDTLSPQHPQFNRARGFDGLVLTLLPAGDETGDIYAGGMFSIYNGVEANKIIRLNADGSVDSSFITGSGFANPSPIPASAGSMRLSIVYVLARAEDGTRDIYAGGIFTTYNGTGANSIIRLHADGSVDSRFVTGSGFNGWVYTIIPAGDGTQDVYVGGSFTSYNGIDANGMIRLHPDGSVNSRFVVGSIFDVGFNIVNTLSPMGDGTGDIYVSTQLITAETGVGAQRVIRLNADGSIDSAFVTGSGFDGIVRTLLATGDGTGDLYVGGEFTTYNGTWSKGIIRLNADGSVDQDFLRVGSLEIYRVEVYVHALFAAGDGTSDIYLMSTQEIIRLKSDGNVDPRFMSNSGGSVLVPAGDGTGDLYVGGSFSTYNGVGAHGIIRLNSDGSVDPRFTTGSGFNARVLALLPVTDGTGDLYVGGEFRTYNGREAKHIMRLNADGSADSGFVTESGFGGPVHALLPAGDGTQDIYVGGAFVTYKGVDANRIIRLHPDGMVNSDFTTGRGFDGGVFTLLPEANEPGAIYVGGEFTMYNGTRVNKIVRLHADGSIDSRFMIGDGFDGAVLTLAPTGDGSGDIYIGGEFSRYNGTEADHIIRLNSDGSVDPRFMTGSGFDLPPHALGKEKVQVLALSRDQSGDIYVGGVFMAYNGTMANGIIRLNADGSVDPAFATGSKSISFLYGVSAEVHDFVSAEDGSGDIYVGGSFLTYNGGTAHSIVRLNPDGSVDTDFVVEKGFYSAVLALARAEDGTGDIYVGGGFRRYKNTIVDGIARLGPDGTSY